MGVGFDAVLGGMKGFRGHDSVPSSLASEWKDGDGALNVGGGFWALSERRWRAGLRLGVGGLVGEASCRGLGGSVNVGANAGGRVESASCDSKTRPRAEKTGGVFAELDLSLFVEYMFATGATCWLLLGGL